MSNAKRFSSSLSLFLYAFCSDTFMKRNQYIFCHIEMCAMIYLEHIHKVYMHKVVPDQSLSITHECVTS